MNFQFQATDGKTIQVYKWGDKNESPKAIVQIIHGMVEHAQRYENFASALNKAGFLVYASDHRGHGKTAENIESIGHFQKKNAWNNIVQDLFQLTQIIRKENPKTPIFLLGHSMGSFLLRNYIYQFNEPLAGVILSATGGNPGLLGKIGIAMAKSHRKIFGGEKRNNVLHKISFGAFNQAFKPNRTDYDWLSRDEKQVDKYLNDPYCGAICTTEFFVELLTGINHINQQKNIAKTPKNLPMLFVAGTKDPVGEQTKGVKQIYNYYKKTGVSDLEIKFFEDARHEIINETNKEEVYNYLINWLEKKTF